MRGCSTDTPFGQKCRSSEMCSAATATCAKCVPRYSGGCTDSFIYVHVPEHFNSTKHSWSSQAQCSDQGPWPCGDASVHGTGCATLVQRAGGPSDGSIPCSVFANADLQELGVCDMLFVTAFIAFGATPPSAIQLETVKTLCPVTCNQPLDESCTQPASPPPTLSPPSPRSPPSPPLAPLLTSLVRMVEHEAYPGLSWYLTTPWWRGATDTWHYRTTQLDWANMKPDLTTWYLECDLYHATRHTDSASVGCSSTEGRTDTRSMSSPRWCYELSASSIDGGCSAYYSQSADARTTRLCMDPV